MPRRLELSLPNGAVLFDTAEAGNAITHAGELARLAAQLGEVLAVMAGGVAALPGAKAEIEFSVRATVDGPPIIALQGGAAHLRVTLSVEAPAVPAGLTEGIPGATPGPRT